MDYEKILTFWFGEDCDDQTLIQQRSQVLWFVKKPENDAKIRTSFAEVLSQAYAGQWDSWKQNARGRLALILLFDQFPRNIYRGSHRAFSYDSQALSLTLEGIERGDDQQLRPVERVFFYLPLEHSEDPRMQEKSVFFYKQLVEESLPSWKSYFETTYHYALRHQEVIERFGRYPHRNEIVGRSSTPEETAFLLHPGSCF